MQLYRCTHCILYILSNCKLFYFHFTIDYILKCVVDIQPNQSLLTATSNFRNLRQKDSIENNYNSRNIPKIMLNYQDNRILPSKISSKYGILHFDFCSYTRLGIRWVSIERFVVCAFRISIMSP